MKSKNNENLNNYISKLYEDSIKSESHNNLEKENKFLKEKLNSIDKKFDTIMKDNHTIKSMIIAKTKSFSKIQSEVENLKKELNSLKSKKTNKSPIKKKKKMSELLRMGKKK